MKKLLLIILLIPFITFAQDEICVKVDSIYSTSKAKDLNRRDIKFGVKQMLEDQLSDKYCLSEDGEAVSVDIYYFGTPKTKLRVAGFEQSKNKTQVGIRLYYNNQIYEAVGESQVEIRAVMIELVDGSLPFDQTVISSAIKKAIIECVSKMP
jgi:hypothetical protein